MKKDYYKILGVHPNSSIHQIEQAYAKLVFENNPENLEEPLKSMASKKIEEISEAYFMLTTGKSQQNTTTEHEIIFENNFINTKYTPEKKTTSTDIILGFIPIIVACLILASISLKLFLINIPVYVIFWFIIFRDIKSFIKHATSITPRFKLGIGNLSDLKMHLFIVILIAAPVLEAVYLYKYHPNLIKEKITTEKG